MPALTPKCFLFTPFRHDVRDLGAKGALPYHVGETRVKGMEANFRYWGTALPFGGVGLAGACGGVGTELGGKTSILPALEAGAHVVDLLVSELIQRLIRVLRDGAGF